jgi:hypothetical protein
MGELLTIYMVIGHWEPWGRNRAKREQSMRRQQEVDCDGKKVEPKMVC